MPFYSRETCDRVREANNIVDVISSYTKLSRRGNRYFGLCPFHNEKTGSFCVTEHSQMYYCFGCHESGNVISFLMKYESMEYTEAIESLAERAGIEIQSETPTGNSGEYRKKRDALLAANKAAAEYYYRKLREKDGELGLNYFKERGLSDKVLNSFGLGYTGPGSGGLYKHLKTLGFEDEILKEAGLILFDEKRGIRDRFFNRVMFPIMDANRHVIAFGARVMGDAKPKYLNSAESPIFSKSNTLYGLFAARSSKRKGFILCEGYMDVISSHMAGFDNAIATLGTALTIDHANNLAKFKRPVYLCYDSDGPGKKAASRAYEILRNAGINSKIIDLSPFKDPDELVKECGKEEFEKRIENASNSFLTIMKWEYETIDTNDPDAEGEFANKLAEGIAEYKDLPTRDIYIKHASAMFGLDRTSLTAKVNEIGGSKYVPTKDPVVTRKRQRGITVEDALKSNEARLLYYMMDKEYYQKCKQLLVRDDFLNESSKMLFDRITEDMMEDVAISPAAAIDIIDNEDDKRFIAGVFANIGDEEESIGADVLKKDVLKRVKQASVKRADSEIDPKDIKRLQQSMEINKEIFDEIESIKF